MHGGSRTRVWVLDIADSALANFQIDLLPTPHRFSSETVPQCYSYFHTSHTTHTKLAEHFLRVQVL